MAEAALETKLCSRCGQHKFLKDFYAPRADGKIKNPCKECSRRASSESQKRRAEKVREYQRAYRSRNHEKVVYLQKERQRRHALTNPQAGRDKSKRHRVANPAKYLFYGARDRARAKGLEFTITQQWVDDRVAAGVCELTGMAISFGVEAAGRCRPMSPSIDRIDSEKGYTPDNCRIVCWAINMAMSEWGEELYASVARAYLERRGG